jgi:hypothetical protein
MLLPGVTLLLLATAQQPGEWQPDMQCTVVSSRDLSVPGCDGWAYTTQETCLQLCKNSSLPAGCPAPGGGYRCAFAEWNLNAGFPPGWCQTANDSCAPVRDPTRGSMFLWEMPAAPPTNATCDLAHYEECADTLQQHGKDCSQAGAPEDVRRCLDFFFGGTNQTEYCCPCITFYAEKYSLPALGPACTGPAPPPPSPPMNCANTGGSWQNEMGSEHDVVVVSQDGCTIRGAPPLSAPSWSAAVGQFNSMWDLIMTFEYSSYNQTFSGHLDGCDPQTVRCPFLLPSV